MVISEYFSIFSDFRCQRILWLCRHLSNYFETLSQIKDTYHFACEKLVFFSLFCAS